tara:strand:- start:187 stop:450 length:264 start_codon:yes stop_codon:yes gene_type:complete
MNKFSQHTSLQDIIRERETDVTEVDLLREGKLYGRFRTLTRTVPSSATNVLFDDAEGDVVTDATYVYTVYSVSGVLKWDRRSLSVGW